MDRNNLVGSFFGTGAVPPEHARHMTYEEGYRVVFGEATMPIWPDVVVVQ